MFVWCANFPVTIACFFQSIPPRNGYFVIPQEISFPSLYNCAVIRKLLQADNSLSYAIRLHYFTYIHSLLV